MKACVFSAHDYDHTYLDAANTAHRHELTYIPAPLEPRTAALAAGAAAVVAFVNDRLDAEVLRALHGHHVRAVALRCSGFNNVDLVTAEQLDITVARVPAYSPYAVAEHAVALVLALNRKLHRAHARVREQNFSLSGLCGFDLHGKTVGVVGAGSIGVVMIRIMLGFGCRVLAYDPAPGDAARALGANFVPLDELLAESDIVSLHCPLTPQTHWLISSASLARMKPGVMLINTSRGGLVETPAVVDGLKSGRIGALGIDVYEEEGDLFFRDLSGTILQDDVFARLLTFPNVMVTAHQAFFTHEALTRIAETTLQNLADIVTATLPAANRVTSRHLR